VGTSTLGSDRLIGHLDSECHSDSKSDAPLDSTEEIVKPQKTRLSYIEQTNRAKGIELDLKEETAEPSVTPLLVRQKTPRPPVFLEKFDNTPSGLRASPHSELLGLYTLESFVTEAEEIALLKFLDSDEGCGHRWKLGSFNGPSMGKRYGIRTDLKRRCFLASEVEMPSILQPFTERIRQVVNGPDALRFFCPNEANAISYRRAEGHYLGSHCDDRQLSGSILVNLCLAGDAVMTYTRDAKGKSKSSKLAASKTYAVRLPRRALQIQSGTVRYDYQHGIRNEDLLSDRRVT